MRIVDANVALRYLLDDHEVLSKRAAEIIDGNQFDLPIEVFCEVVFVLEKVYKAAREDICGQLTGFLEATNNNLPHREVVLAALRTYSERRLDFVDCLLAGYAEVEKAEICTFDNELRRFIDRLEIG